jgi:glycosyltransferase involved in cell wall biosynthesis
MKPTEIAVALTHYNRFAFTLECLAQVVDDLRVGEIVISDDVSTDGSYDQLRAHFAPKSKVRIFRNEKNLDCYANKQAAVRRCFKDWVVLFDSDNILYRAYLDVLFSLPDWDENTVYCPVFAQPHFDYRAFAGLTVTRANLHQHLDRPSFQTALNTANYFFHRSAYLAVWNSTVNPHTADSIYMAYCLLDAGKSLAFVPGLQYFHRVHDKSHYKLNHHKTGSFVATTLKLLRGLR